LEVVETVALTPSMRRLRLRAPNLGDLRYLPGQDLMFAVPDGDGRTYRRRYTIRRLDAQAGLLDVDAVVHGDGPGARWAATARPGARIDAIGPRGSITLAPGDAWHLFTAEDSALPATFAMVEALPPGSRAIALVEVDGPVDEQPLQSPPGSEVQLHWVHRGGAEPGRSTVLVEAVTALELPGGNGHAYLNGELAMVNGLRAVLAGRGLRPDQLSVKPYWRLGVANAAHGEPARD
jgi:NADPH-dependent ferric siderophore reductase